MSANRLAGLIALVAVLMCPALTVAQQTDARVFGKVSDSSAAVLPGVTITVTSKQTGAMRTVVSDADGSYAVTNLGPAPTP